MKARRLTLFFSVFLLVIVSPLVSYGEWKGPIEVISGSWGKEPGQFYYASQDTFDAFPRNFGIDKNNNVVIADEGNRRIYIYTHNGKLINIIQKPASLPNSDFAFGTWPDEIKLLPYNDVIVFACDYKQVPGGYQPLKQCIMDFNGKILSKIDVAETFVTTEGIFIKKKETYYQYSPTGQLLKTYTERPLELGVVERGGTADGYKYRVQYPDISNPRNVKVYTITVPLNIREFKRDITGNLYAIATAPGKHTNDIVYRYDLCEGTTTKMQIPESQYNITLIKDRPHPIGQEVEVIAEFGQPVVAPTGDTFTWKRTPETYSILKWTWQGPPDAPQSLKVSPSKTGLSLTWEQPQKDADRVTSCEINRSGNVCGPFQPIGTVAKGVLTYEDQGVKQGETWYYQVRAMRDKTPSGYSNKAVSTR